MFRRILPLVLALCVLVPIEVLARFVESSREPDRCACRRDDDRHRQGPVARRIDCCDAAPATAHAATTALVIPPTAMLPAPVGHELEVIEPARPLGSAVAKPRARTRGPPLRLFASFERWLI